ncbi:MAG TPA: hypothetical protein VEA60_15920 [Allosphingosinicella sp.]|nr:hypothetical protein [Allosphingosinicella sp.]
MEPDRVRRFRAGAAALLGLVVADAAAAAPPRAMLPPELGYGYERVVFEGLDEPPLWRAREARGYRSRIRLSIAGIVRAKASIRIDRRRTGALSGRLVLVDLDSRARPERRIVRRFRVSAAQSEALDRLIGEAGLWTIHPQFYVHEDPEMICLDGMELVFERVDARGYRFSTANAQCTAPGGMLRVAEKMMEIARAGDLKRWLR